MPLVEVFGLPYVTINDRFSNIYWTEVTKGIRYEYGFGIINQPDSVKEALRGNLEYFIDSFKDIIHINRSIPFLIFVHRIHESSLFIADRVQKKDNSVLNYLTTQDISDLPIIRRVLKLIMEELLIEKFEEEINEELIRQSMPNKKFVEALEEMFYLGYRALENIEHLNFAIMFDKSVALKSHKKNPLTVFTNSPYFQIFETIKKDMATYETRYYYNINDKLDSLLDQTFGINFNSFPTYLPKGLGTFIVEKDDLISKINASIDATKPINTFFGGLVLNVNNKIELGLSFVKTQENNRLTYRPIIEFKDKNEDLFWILGQGKTFESTHALRTNAILWGKLPNEWKENDSLKAFTNEMELHREEAMMDMIAIILNKRKIKFDKDIKSLKKLDGQGFKINTEGLGQIDLIFLNEKDQIIYVCECKNNRPRFDTFNWKSDYDQFTSLNKKKNYEKQLTDKFNWVRDNKNLIQNHFNFILDSSFDFTNWRVEGKFILMTPSIYKYDGLFPVLTIEDLEIFLDNNFHFDYQPFIFEREDGSAYEVNYPYFKNIRKLVEDGII